MKVAGSWRHGACLLVVGCAIAASTAQAAVIALKRDTGLNTGGPIDARFTSATVVQATVCDAPLWSPGESAWANGGGIAVPAGNFLLYKFDLTSVGDLANATINLAELRLYHTAGNGGQGLGAVAPVVTHDWTEGLGTTVWTYYPGTAGGVSYAHPIGYNTGPYQNASGGATAPTASWGASSDSVFSMSADAGTALDPDDGYWNATDFNVYDVTSHVQAWVSGTSSNYGWAQSPGYWDFHHSEIGWQYQPVLFIDYTPQMPTVTLSINSATIAENGGTATVTATLSSTSTQTVTVDLAYSGSAVRDTDYTGASQIVISAGNSSGAMTITGVDDGTYEGDETIVVDVSGVTNALEDGVQQVSTTIDDDESVPAVTLSIDNASIAENGGTATMTATLSNASTQTVTVDLAYSGSAVRGTDYTAALQIVIGAGSSTATATVTGINDTISEGNETILVDINGVTNGTEDGVQQVGTTIVDDDGGQAAVIALKRDAGLNTGGPIDARFTSATVVQTTVSDAPLWSPGESAWANGGGIAVPTGNVLLYKFDLTSVGDLANATINLAELRLYHTAGNGGEGLGAVAPVVTHDWTEGLGTTVWTYYPGAAGGVSYAHPIGYNTGPYQNASGGATAPTASWGASSDSVFSMSADAGTALDPDDGYWNATDFNVYDVTSQVQAWVNGTSPNYGWAQSPGYWDFHHSEIGWQYQPVLFVDYTPVGSSLPTVAFDVTSSSGAESVTPASLAVSLNAAYGQVVTVDYTVTGGTATGGGVDYTLAAGTLTFSVNDVSETVDITIVDDAAVESNETIEVTLSNPVNATLGANTVHTYTIQDNDVAGNDGTGLLGEYYDNIDFTSLTLTRTDATVAFQWGTGSPDASIGADTFSVRWTGQVQPLYSETYTFYTNTDDGVRLWVNNQLVVDQWVDQAPNEVSGTITLSAGVQYDIEMEYYENGGGAVAELRWSSASQAKQIIPQSQLYPPTGQPTVTLSIDNATIAENGGTATVTATLSSTSTQAVTVDLAYSGSATHSTDYTGASQIVIAASAISDSVTITAADDAAVEGDETVVVDISGVTNAVESGVQQVSTTITDDDSSASVSLLSPRDFLYKGYYIVEKNVDFPDLNYGQAFTHRYVSGQLRFLTYAFFGNVAGGGHHVVEFAPPASLGGTVTSRTNHWPDIWTGTGLTAGNGIWTGLWYDQAQERLWTTWAIDYPDAAAESYTKSLVIRTLNADGTVSNVGGPWGLEGVQQRHIYGGVTAIPQWFQTAYSVGPYACGWGGYASRMGIGPISLGPTFYAIPEPTGYAVGDIPANDFDTVMDHGNGTLGADWYANGLPTSFDRGVRNADVTNDYDTPYWQSPAPDGVGRWTWGDSNWDTGVWIETPNKRGFVLIPKLCSGRTWYETSTLHCQRQTAEIQIFDPNMLGEVILGTRAVWDTYPTYRWQISDELLPLGFLYGRSGNGPDGGPAGASYDATTQTLYVYCVGGTNLNSYILVYDVDQVASSVNDAVVGETSVTGTVTGTRANTENKDGIYESIQEVTVGSTSQLEHEWTFDVTSGSSVTFKVKGYRPGNADGDDFVFAYSTNGTNWTNMVTVSRSADDGTFQTYTMPSSTQGTVYVRVQDSDRTNGNTSLDTICIDEMYFQSTP